MQVYFSEIEIFLFRFSQNAINITTNRIKFILDLPIGQANNMQSYLFQVHRSICIIHSPLMIVMLSTVNLNHESSLMAVKINDIPVNHLLPLESNRIAC